MKASPSPLSGCLCFVGFSWLTSAPSRFASALVRWLVWWSNYRSSPSRRASPHQHGVRPDLSTHGQEELEDQELQSNNSRTDVASEFEFEGEMKLIRDAPVAYSVCVVVLRECNSPVWAAMLMELLEIMEAWLSCSCCFMVVKLTEIRWVKRLAALVFRRKKKCTLSEWWVVYLCRAFIAHIWRGVWQGELESEDMKCFKYPLTLTFEDI